MRTDSERRAAEENRASLEKTRLDQSGRRPVPSAQAVRAFAAETKVTNVAPADPRRVGTYQILRRLGEGGMGSVFLGYQAETGQQVAIKVLSEHLTGNPSYVDRFKREARSVQHLDHPNIVRGFEVGEDADGCVHFLVLEYVDGPSAHALLDRFGRLPVGDAVHIILDIARALEHAHSRNVIHRDIKPDNILLTLSGVAKLADLGLARRIDEQSNLTGARDGFGTPYYMPYEQSINARRADARSDIYALGATLYHLLTGDVPFPGAGPLEVAEKKRAGTFKAASTVNPQIPQVMDQILDKMLAGAPKNRYQTASELIVDLERAGLAAAVPSFVDPDVALQDPLVRRRLGTAPEPTRIDLNSAMGKLATSSPDPEVWYLRYRNPEGRWRKARATTQEIRRRLVQGRLSAAVEASHDPRNGFRALNTYADFQAIGADSETKPRQPTSRGEQATPVVEEDPIKKPTTRKRSQTFWLLSIGLLLFIALAALSYYFAP